MVEPGAGLMAKKTYLLDNNTLNDYVNKTVDFLGWLSSRKSDRMFTCSIVIGEVKAGHRINEPTDPAARKFFESRIRSTVATRCWNVEQSTGKYYADIIEAILKANPRTLKKNGKPVLSLHDHLQKLNVGINDVWIAAVALERNAVLVTEDAMPAIRAASPTLRVESWKQSSP
jgi:predicted nucleic acid-binding protein